MAAAWLAPAAAGKVSGDVPFVVAEATRWCCGISLSPFDRWLTACCDLAAEHEDSNENLWESYKAWCIGKDVKTGGGAAFKQQIEGSC